MSDTKELERDPATNDPLLNHEYDGIRELDNPLPGWWKMTFYITIVFGIFYVYHYHLGSGKTTSEELRDSLQAVELAKHSAKKPEAFSEEALLAAVTDSAKLAQGKEVYVGKCAVCHGNAGQGSIGPNLTDAYWIHGKGGVKDIVAVVQTGVVAKGMPAWGTLLKPDEQIAVTAYVKSLVGTNPANPKAPQGEKVE